LSGVAFFVIAIGPAVGMGYGAWSFAAHGHPAGLAGLLWTLSFTWLVFAVFFPAMAGQNPDLTHLLRFPISFSSWFILYLVYGLAAPSTLIGMLWSLAIAIGVTVAQPHLWAWTFLVVAVFWLFNLLLARTILAWIERWLAQRRTREIVTGVFLVFALAAQFLNPAFHEYGKGLPFGIKKDTVATVVHRAEVVQRALPPGFAASALSDPLTDGGSGAIPLVLLVVSCGAAGWLLAIRLRAESRGENFSEAPARSSSVGRGAVRQRRSLDFAGPIGAIFEKDLRYLMRSGPMLYQLAVPLLMVFIFSSGSTHSEQYAAIRSEFALPLGLIWAFLGLNRLACNSLGMEGHGIQFYFLSPTPLRTIMLGKNCFHAALFAVEALLISGFIVFRFGRPSPVVAAATVAWLVFAVPAYFAAANVISMVLPFRMNMTRMKQGPGALGNGFASLFTQVFILGFGALVYLPFAALGHPWMAVPVLLGLGGGAVFAWLRILSGAERILRSRLEPLLLEVAKTA
ncbi:MAG: hypothetical protein ACLGP3_02380, partial [Acidobacteriota bacterium]